MRTQVALELEALADAGIQVLGASMPETPQGIPSEEATIDGGAREMTPEEIERRDALRLTVLHKNLRHDGRVARAACPLGIPLARTWQGA